MRATDGAATRKRRGAWYTPLPYVEAIVARVLRERLDAARTYDDVLACTVLDPACGDGVFLAAAQRLLVARALQLSDHDPERVERDVARACIHGVDVDPAALAAARERLGADAELRRADALDAAWESLFPQVFARGGFGVVVANPPYVFGEWLPADALASLRARYVSLGAQPDLYAAFLELAVTRLCAPGGAYAFVVPDAVLVRAQRAPLRRMLAAHAMPTTIAHPGPIFTRSHRAAVSAAVLIGTRGGDARAIAVEALDADGAWTTVNTLAHERVRADDGHRFLIGLRPGEWERLERARGSGTTLGDLVQRISRGEEIGKARLRAHATEDAPIAVAAGEAVAPYRLGPQRRYVPALRKRAAYYAGPKILVRKTDDRVIACRDPEGVPTLQSVYNLHVAPQHADVVLALLNSRFAQWFFARTVTDYKKVLPQITQAELLTLPVPRRCGAYGALVAAAERGDAHAVAAIDARVDAEFAAPA